MDGSPVGPLSYDVSKAEGDTSAERAIVVSLVVVVALLFLGMVVGWFLLGVVESKALIADGLPLLLVVVALGIALSIAKTGMRRTRRNALVAVGTAAVFAALLQHVVLGNIKAALPQIRASAKTIQLPPGFRFVAESHHGDRFCRHGCPTLVRQFAAPASDGNPVRTLMLTMVSQGWLPTNDVPADLATDAVKHGIVAQIVQHEPHVVELQLSRPG